MPSEAQTSGVAEGPAALALEALRSRVESFRSAVAVAQEEIRTFTTQRRGVSEFRAEEALMELGPFATGRIDPERFGVLLRNGEEVTPEAMEILAQAETVLKEFAVGDDLHHVALEPGGDLRDTVKDALTDVGRIFGAARAVELARSGRFDPDQHMSLLGSLPFRKWNRAERQMAPPLVVELGAEDLFPVGLGEFLDGAVKIVLVVKGHTTPAPLARLITPGTFVVQTADPTALEALAASRHPGIGLLFEEERPEQARFVHDPDSGDAPWKRLHLEHVPEEADVGRGRRAPSWMEELMHLKALAKAPLGLADASPTAGSPEPEESAPADQLAAWLLSQTAGL